MSGLFEDIPGFDEPVPEILYSEYEEGPFQECIKCGRNLEEYEGFYEIQKIYKHGRPIWEHAICSDCGDDLVEEYSDESIEKIRSYLSEMSMYEDSLDICHRCEDNVKTGREHMIAGLCTRENLLLSPMVLCIECLDEMNELLSKETRDSWDDFVENNVPAMPAEMQPSSNPALPSIG